VIYQQNELHAVQASVCASNLGQTARQRQCISLATARGGGVLPTKHIVNLVMNANTCKLTRLYKTYLNIPNNLPDIPRFSEETQPVRNGYCIRRELGRDLESPSGS
jgi:hypothetical protein